jgi:predicted nucleic-acid-binding Zn-ribbon protein
MEGAQSNEPLCIACGSVTQFLGQIPLRAGGSDGISKLFFGEWAELGEQVIPIEMFRCTACSHIEFYDVDFSLPTFTKKRKK